MNNYACCIFICNTLIINHIYTFILLFLTSKPLLPAHFGENILNCAISVVIRGLNPIFCNFPFYFFLVKELCSQ